jgi:hypothetical protein
MDNQVKKKEVANIGHGIAKIYWKTGGWSVCSIGSTRKGKRWFAASNWTSGSTTKHWSWVLRVEFIDTGVDTFSEMKFENVSVKYLDDDYKTQTMKMAETWKMNDDKNNREANIILPNGITYGEYCEARRSVNGGILPLDCLIDMLLTNEDE